MDNFPEQAVGKLMLQQCTNCGQVNYPSRELCGNCLADQLIWKEQPRQGTLLAATTLHYSLEPRFNERLPLRIGSIQLDCGPVVIAWVPSSVNSPKMSVSIRESADGNRVLMAEERAQ